LDCLKRSLRIMGRNLLPIFGFNFVRHLTSLSDKLPLIILSRAVERLHRRLEDALRACAPAATRSEELPIVLLRLRAQPREDNGLSPTEAVFGAPIMWPYKFFCKTKKFQLIPLSKIFPKLCMLLLLLCLVTAMWSLLSSLSTTAPTPFCAVAPTPSTSESGHGTRSSLLAASRPAWQWTPSLAAREAAADLPFRPCHETVPELFSYPARRFLHARDGWCLHSLQRCGTHPINGHRQRGWTSDLFSFQPRPEFGGSPVESCLRPWGRSNQSCIL
jgi:hypothetical protein